MEKTEKLRGVLFEKGNILQEEMNRALYKLSCLPQAPTWLKARRLVWDVRPYRERPYGAFVQILLFLLPLSLQS